MITNERQYKISRSQLDTLKKAIDTYDFDEALKTVKHRQLVQAHLDALKSELEYLSMQIQEYDALKSGKIEILKASSLEELPNILIRARIAKGLSQKDLAETMGLKEQQIQRYEAEEYASANLGRLAEVAKALGISIKEVAEFGNRQSTKLAKEFSWDQFPVKEMYKKNWFEFSGSLSEALDSAEELAEDFITESLEEPMPLLARQRIRSGGNSNPYALLAWQAQVVKKAKVLKPGNKYNRALITEKWLQNLAHLSRYNDGPQKSIEYLLQAGIRTVIVPHLSNTYLDGAAILSKVGPIIGLTLRYDRVDNFWFVLFHELFHVKDHLIKGSVETIFDDLEANADGIEKEADEGASEMLIPSEKWKAALVRYTRSKESVKEFAEELQIHAAIVAGKIRQEAGNYTILNDFVGFGEVRRQFPSIDFSN